jgi:DNA polymerase-3 subunit beta
MKLVIERAALLKSLAHAQSVVERRNTIPILSNVKLSTTERGLALNATDMDIDIIETASAEIEVQGATTAPAHTLYEIARKLPEGSQVELEGAADGSQITLRSGRSKFSLAALPVEDFPMLSGGDLPYSFTLPAGDLRRLIDRSRFAISTEETRYYLNGIYLHAATGADGEMLRAVATDGHRMARVDAPLPDGAAGMPGVIVPRKTVAELRKLIEETTHPVTVSLSETKIRFAFDGTILTSKLIDGTFPDYERVIPAGNDKDLEVPCKEFAAAVDRVSVISTEKTRAIKMTLESRSLILSAQSPDSGNAVEELEANYHGGLLEIGFNSRYLLDIAQQITGDSIRFSLSDSASPAVVSDVADDSAVYVLMPMRV